MELPVVNHPDYVAKINDDNKFPIKKFGALADHLIKEGVVKKILYSSRMFYRNNENISFIGIYKSY